MKYIFSYPILSFPFLVVLLFPIEKINAKNKLTTSLRKEIETIEQFYNQRTIYDEQKQHRILKIKNELLVSSDLEKNYDLNKQLYKEYFSYKSYDAYNIVLIMGRLANQLHSEEKAIETILFKADILLCSGLFYETFEVLQQLPKSPMGKFKVSYFRIMTRLYGDMISYNNLSYYHSEYKKLNHLYADSLLKVANINSIEYQMVSAMKLTDEGKTTEAMNQLISFLETKRVTEHQKAMMYSSLGWIVSQIDKTEEQIHYLLKSIEFDVRSATYETTSGRVLAKTLLDMGEVELAHNLVIRAIKDAEFYGAHQRKVEISRIVPIIEVQLKELQRLKVNSVIGILILILISLFVILFLWVRLIKQYKKVTLSTKLINEQNALLSDNNKKLSVSNKMKEEYLASYFELSSVYFHQIENIKEKINSLLLQKKYSGIATFLNDIIGQDEKEQLLVRFDALFLRLFPTFIKDLNSVLYQSHQLINEDAKSKLSSELRVIAFYRLGITSGDRIASILGVSRNTIYTYRNRIKTKVKMSSDEFDEFVLNIPAY